MRKIGFDRATIRGLVEEDDDSIVFSSIIAREIVQKYPEGDAYKPGRELEKAAHTLKRLLTRPVVLNNHPDTGLAVKLDDIKGRLENIEFVKNLLDPKTKRPMDRGIRANIRLFKDVVDPQLLQDMIQGDKRDVSIGFTYDSVLEPGVFRGKKYDFRQHNIFIDHVCAGLPLGRCPSPFCGIGLDRMLTIGLDPWEITEASIRSGHTDPGKYDPNSFRTIDITSGVKAVTACPRGKFKDGKCTEGTEIQTYVFDRSVFTVTQAKAWFNKHKGDEINLSEEKPIDCVCASCGYVEPKNPETACSAVNCPDCGEPMKVKESQGATDQETEYERFMSECVESGKTLDECVAEWKAAHPEGDCVLCDKIKRDGPKRFAALLFRTYGQDVLKLFKPKTDKPDPADTYDSTDPVQVIAKSKDTIKETDSLIKVTE